MANPAGLDLGSRTIKAISLSKSKEGFGLTGIGFQELPFPEEEIPREELVGDALRRFMRESGMRLKDVTVSLSGEFSSVKAADMPKMGREELANVLPYEIEQYLAINPEENVIDFQILGDSKSDATKMNVILAAGRLDAAESLYKVVSSAKLNCSAIDVDELALANMFEVNYAWEEDYRKVVCLLNIGNRTTSVIIFDEGVVKYNRIIPIAGEVLTKDIQRDFALKAEQAEDLKKEQAKIVVEDSSSFSLTMFDREDRSLRLYEAISTSVNKMIQEVKRCFDHYDTQFKGRSVERILLSGGGARLKNLERFLADKLGVAVEFVDPFRQIRIPSRGPAAGIIESNGVVFGVSVGLALRRFG